MQLYTAVISQYISHTEVQSLPGKKCAHFYCANGRVSITSNDQREVYTGSAITHLARIRKIVRLSLIATWLSHINRQLMFQ